jgi:hypothetical protein
VFFCVSIKSLCISAYISVYTVYFVYFVLRKLSVAEVGAVEVFGLEVGSHIREVAAAEGPTVESSLPLH